jgi:hypothetical protein
MAFYNNNKRNTDNKIHIYFGLILIGTVPTVVPATATPFKV